MIRDDLGKRFCKLWIRPIVLFILHSSVSRCFSKVKDKRVSRMIPRCFWNVACITLSLFKTSGECNIALNFRLKMTSCACFFWIWVKIYFPLKGPSIYHCQIVIYFKSRGIVIMDQRKEAHVVSK